MVPTNPARSGDSGNLKNLNDPHWCVAGSVYRPGHDGRDGIGVQYNILRWGSLADDIKLPRFVGSHGNTAFPFYF